MSSSSIIITICFLFSLTCLGQSHIVSGRVLDPAGGPVPLAGVTLQQMQDSTYVTNAFANELGLFSITVPGGNYRLSITATGFDSYEQDISVSGIYAVPDIVLSESVEELDAVVINKRRPVITRKIDRIEFNVENSTLSSENAWEILRKTPGVTAAGDNLSIRGSRGIMVMINDKKVYLTGTELKNLLENTDGSNVKSVEVITTPPAKYEAQGSAILNIKLKKGGAQGYKGSVAGAYVQGVYPKGVVSTNHFYTSKKLSVTGGAMFGSGTYYTIDDTNSTYTNPNGTIASVWKSREEAFYKAESQRTYNLDVQFQPDSLTTFSVGGTAFASLQSTAEIVTPTKIYGATGTLDSLFTTNNRRSYPQKNSSFNAAYERRFNEKDKLSISGDYANNYYSESNDIRSLFSLPAALPYRNSTINTGDTRNIYLYSIQADYSAVKWGSAIEAGIRYGAVQAENNYEFENAGDVPNPSLSNTFLYDEKVFAAYAGMEREFGKLTLKAGLRTEHTHLEGDSRTTGELNRQDYLKFFPTIYSLYKLNEKNQLGLSYGKRIIRPQYGELNPFRSYTNPYSYRAGNPNLQPALAHNISLLYTYNNKYNVDLYYRYEKDPSMSIVYQDYDNNTLISQVTNIKSNQSFGVDMNTNFDLFDWWTNGVQANVGYGRNVFQGIDGMLYTNKLVNFTTATNSRFTLTKAKDLTAEVYFDYQTATITGASKMSPLSSLMFSIRKKFLKANAEVTLMFLDVYKGQVYEITTNYANQNTSSRIYSESQNLRVQFRYSFGNQKLKGERNREQTDEQRRL